MAGEVDKVIIPVVTTLDDSATRDVGTRIRTARDAGLVGPSAGQSGSAPVTVQGILREAQALERSLRSLTGEVDRLVHAAQTATAHGTPPGQPPAPPLVPLVGTPGAPGAPTPAVGGAGGATPPPGGGAGAGAGAGGGGIVPTALGVFLGQFAERTLSTALRAGYNEVQRMATASRSIQEAAYLAASARGEPGEAPTLLGELRAGPGFASKVGPESIANITRQMALAGMKPTGRDAALLAEIGLTGLGSPEAGANFATTLFRDTRSTRAIELLTSIDQTSKANGLNFAEQVHQFESLNGFFKSIQGGREITPEGEQRRAELQAFYASLPGGMGKGDGAVRIEQATLAAATQDPLGRSMMRRAFIEDTGKDPFTPQGAVDFEAWVKSEKRTPAMLKMTARWGGGENTAATALFRMRHGGLTAEDAKALQNASPDERAVIVDKILTRDAAERAIARQARVDGADPGADSMATRAGLERNRASDDKVSSWDVWFEKQLARVPYGTAAWEVAKGLPGYAIAGGAGLLGGQSLLRRGSRWLRGRGTAGAAGLVGPSVRQVLNAGRLARAGGYLAGGAALANEASSAAATPGDDWGTMLLRNLFPTLVGGAGTLVTKSPAVGAGLFGATHWLQSLFTGGDAATANAAIPPGARAIGGDGWSADAVAEHLGLLRTLAGAGPTAREAGIAPRTAGDAGLVPMRADGRGGSRLDPYDPRIADAAAAADIPVDDFRAILKQESGFNPFAVSPKGAKGLGQLMPGTARDYRVRDPFDVKENLRGSAQHYARLLRKFKGNRTLAMAAYNAGEGNVAKYGGVPPFAETRDYVRKVQGHARRFSAADSARLRASAADLDVPIGESPATRAERDLREFERLALDRHFGPEDAQGNKVIIHLEPGSGLDGIINPTRAVIPGPRRSR